MVRNPVPSAFRLIPFDRLPWKKAVGFDSATPTPTPIPSRRLRPARVHSVSKIEFQADEGVVEIRDSRLFGNGQEPFCLAFVEESVRPGLANRVEIRLASTTCRIEFPPGRFNRDELARNVALALKAASLAAKDRAQAPNFNPDRGQWINLTAEASSGRPSIRETLIDREGHIVSRPRLAIHASKNSTHSKRPLRRQPRRVRVNPPRPRASTSAAAEVSQAEPIALAFSVGSIFGKNSRQPMPLVLPLESVVRSRRMVNLALAGGSLALAVAGVILPGIPALPFLLLTGHFLIKSSPEFCQNLKKVPGISALLEKVDSAGVQSVDRKSLLKMFGFTLATVAAFVVFRPPLPVVILLETGVMVYYGLREFRKSSRTGSTPTVRSRMAFVA